MRQFTEVFFQSTLKPWVSLLKTKTPSKPSGPRSPQRLEKLVLKLCTGTCSSSVFVIHIDSSFSTEDQFFSISLRRMLTVYPQTKTYFSHWTDLSFGSAQVKKHGKTIMASVDGAVSKIDDLTTGLLSLSELHAFQLRIDPANFKVIVHYTIFICSVIILSCFYQ